MGKMTVTVRPGMHYGETHQGGDVIEITRKEFESFGDKVIYPAIDATKEAWDLALERNVVSDMRAIVGTGKDGRILKSDVEGWLDGRVE